MQEQQLYVSLFPSVFINIKNPGIKKLYCGDTAVCCLFAACAFYWYFMMLILEKIQINMALWAGF